MITLGVNIDHVATIRQARRGIEPEPVTAAAICELAGADCITIHLREDRRHINDRDVRLIAQTIQTRLNLEMACTNEIQKIALEVKPHSVCLVPEKREEITTEGGLDVCCKKEFFIDYVAKFKEAGITVSMFIAPCPEQVEASYEINADFIEIHTGCYANSKTDHDIITNFQKIKEAAKLAKQLGLRVNAGHGLNYINVKKILTIPGLEELNIGHSIISRAVFVGLDQSVREMKAIIDTYNNAILSGSLSLQ